MEFSYVFPTWHENSMEYITLNPMECPCKISFFSVWNSMGYNTGNTILQDCQNLNAVDKS